MQRRVYLDHASTTNVNPDVLKTYENLLAKYYVNSESLYNEGTEINRMVEKSRSAVASLLGVSAEDIIFTSGSSESNSSVIKGVPFACPGKKKIVTSNVEHSSILNACKEMQDIFGYEVVYLPVDHSGKVSLDQVKEALDDSVCLVSLMYVNNESGAVNPIPEIAEYVKKHSQAYFHTDLTQSIGKVDLDLRNVDCASMSAHKLEGLKGSGILLKRKYVPFVPLINGGEQEFGQRGGTANAPADMVFAKTLRLALENGRKYHDYIHSLQERLLAGLRGIDGIHINSPDDCIVSLVNFSYPVIPSEVMQNALNERGFMVSARSTCASKENNPSYVLEAMGWPDDICNSCIRVTLGYENTADEIDGFLDAVKEIIGKYGRTPV